jgi:hypothetical protein
VGSHYAGTVHNPYTDGSPRENRSYPGAGMDKQQRIELIGLSLFSVGLCGILLFFYLAYILFTGFTVTGGIGGTDSAQITTDFFTYLIQLTMPILILLVVGAMSILVAQYGISTYSRDTGKNS